MQTCVDFTKSQHNFNLKYAYTHIFLRIKIQTQDVKIQIQDLKIQTQDVNAMCYSFIFAELPDKFTTKICMSTHFLEIKLQFRYVNILC